MRTPRRRHHRGGVAIASGSDGCVFDTHFEDDGMAVPAQGTISKVFAVSKQDVALNEYLSIELVRKATNGRGVAPPAPGQLKTIPDVKDTIPVTLIRRGEYSPNGCGRVADQKDKGGDLFYIIESPRVKGSLVDLKTKTLSAASFGDAVWALQGLSTAGLCHMDIARRNIFLSNENVPLVGDFGNLLNIHDPDLKTKIAGHLTKYRLRTLSECFTSDGSTAALNMAMLIYMAKDVTEFHDEVNDLLVPVAEGVPKFKDYYLFSVLDHEIFPGFDVVAEMKAYLEFIRDITAPGTAWNPEKIWGSLKEEFARSDIRCLVYTIYYSSPSLGDKGEKSPTDRDALTSLWKTGTLPPTPTVESLRARLAAIRGKGRPASTRRRRRKFRRATLKARRR